MNTWNWGLQTDLHLRTITTEEDDFTRLLQKVAMSMLLSKASEGDFIGNGWGSEDFTLSGFLFRKRMVVPNRLKVRPEAFPKSIPMSANEHS